MTKGISRRGILAAVGVAGVSAFGMGLAAADEERGDRRGDRREEVGDILRPVIVGHLTLRTGREVEYALAHEPRAREIAGRRRRPEAEEVVIVENGDEVVFEVAEFQKGRGGKFHGGRGRRSSGRSPRDKKGNGLFYDRQSRSVYWWSDYLSNEYDEASVLWRCRPGAIARAVRQGKCASGLYYWDIELRS